MTKNAINIRNYANKKTYKIISKESPIDQREQIAE